MLESLLNNPSFMAGLFGGLISVVMLIVLFVFRVQFLKGSKWGANFSKVNCPECGKELPRVRTPKNLRQMLWGGWTCEGCGNEYDKWLNAVGDTSKNAEIAESGADKDNKTQ